MRSTVTIEDCAFVGSINPFQQIFLSILVFLLEAINRELLFAIRRKSVVKFEFLKRTEMKKNLGNF